MDLEEGIEKLVDVASDYGISLTRNQAEKLVGHLCLVEEKNKVVNLTRIVDDRDALILHILDSLLLASRLDEAPEGAFLDIGTGAGYPGLPLAVVTGRRGVLVDSVGKKVNAVRGFIDELGLAEQVEARHVRVEELAKVQKGAYTAVVARAVAQVNVLVEYATPFLCKDGLLVIAKARPDEDEILAGNKAAAICGLRPVALDEYELPEGLGHREVLTYRRAGSPKVKLPRKTGMASHQPLGV